MGVSRKQAERISSVLSEGLPYIQRFKGKIIVVKYGGAVMSNENLKQGFARDIALMQLVGMRPVVVHGGGPQIAKELKKAGVISEFISGHRITDKSTMSVVKKVLGTKINNEIVNSIKKSNGQAVSFNHNKSKIIKASKLLGPNQRDIGLVGKVDRVILGNLKKQISRGFIPVIAPIGINKEGKYLNINADIVAGKVAESLKAEKLILLTDVKGISDDKGRLISKISEYKGKRMQADGIIKGGMMPKLEAALEAKMNGVKSCHIIDGRLPHAILLEVLTLEGVGTMIS
ncbi:MAG TPA: acetylglutamate kinase [SAR86 cluster bacterium]|nr:acetylglutamate kinase [SAR86 cluster bacterium]|tara:strand:+ start:5765 stop:6628 length:864 start_codon:yes stop_codon:yes gene_type:complete